MSTHARSAVGAPLRGSFLALILLLGCTVTDRGDSRSRDTSVIGASVEGQRLLDSARSAFLAGDREAAAGQLRAAAVFFRAHPGARTSTARGAFGAVALDLDRAADEVRAGRMRDTTILDATFARAQLAAAEHYRGRAADAWNRGRVVGAGEELALAADHLERALRDARTTTSPDTVETVRAARALTLALLRGTPPPDVDARLATFAREVQRLESTLRAGAG